MPVKVTGIESAVSAMKLAIKRIEKRGAEENRRAAVLVIQLMMKNTPVWEGETVRNFKAGFGMPRGTSAAINNGPTGPTNSLPLGDEPRRDVNELAALAPVRALPVDKLKSITVTNTVNSAKWSLVDSGNAPDKKRARNPGGVSQLAIAVARAKLRNHK